MKLIVALGVIAVGTTCLWFPLCGTSDVTDDLSRNGGYDRGAVFFLQTPIAVHGKRYTQPLPLAPSGADTLEIPAGCRLRIVRVRSLYGMLAVAADNIPRMDAEAQFVDGPLAGTTVMVTSISARTLNRGIKLDPTFLQSTPPPTATGSPMDFAKARELLQLLPETQQYEKTLSPQRLTIVTEPPSGDQLQLSLASDVDPSMPWNRFRVSPAGEITVWSSASNSWIDLPTWRASKPH